MNRLFHYFWIIIFAASVSILFAACGVQPDEDSGDVQINMLLQHLQESGLSAEDFSRKLADTASTGSTGDLVQILPLQPRRELQNLGSALLVNPNTPETSDRYALPTAQVASPSSQGANSSRAVVAIIALGGNNLWLRNVLEWFALDHFNTYLRNNYTSAVVCTGYSATWKCFTDGIHTVGPTSSQIDLLIFTHGAYDILAKHAYAIDNNGTRGYAADILTSGWSSRYRMGFFAPCFAAHGMANFPFFFLAFGGKAAYGSDRISSPFSDITIWAQMGSYHRPMGQALQIGNNSFLDWFNRAWMNLSGQYGIIGEVSGPKIAFGDLNQRI